MKALLLALAAVASTPDQFDLICKSSTETIRYRIDVTAGEWCWQQCGATWKVASITPTRITFKDEDTPRSRSFAYVDRVTGEWLQASGRFANRGHCDPAPFSGFPRPPTRF